MVTVNIGKIDLRNGVATAFNVGNRYPISFDVL
jgi:hypothetical protein